MLNVYLGNGWNDREDVVLGTAIYFNSVYTDEWMEDSFTKEMVLDVDKTEIYGPNLAISPILGGIPITGISGGVKTLILINNDPTHIYNASQCGDNCAKWLLEIGKRKDVTIRLGHIMNFDEDKQTDEHIFGIRIVNNYIMIRESKGYLYLILFTIGTLKTEYIAVNFQKC